jgi:hypothetical protein
MTCRDSERGWNELIDMERAFARGEAAGIGQVDPAMADLERALLDHAEDCAACCLVASRYRILRRALQAGVHLQSPPAGLADRILAEIERPSPAAWAVYGETRPWRIGPAAMAMAGMVAIAVGMALYLTHINQTLQARLDRPTTVLHPTPAPHGHDESAESKTIPAGARNLNTAVADATAATWDLARSASEPAARISRQVLSAATEADREPSLPNADAGLETVSAGASVLSLAALAPDTAAAEAMLQQVGDHLATEVRPLSDTARHAFRFLLGPATAKPAIPAKPPAPKGA